MIDNIKILRKTLQQIKITPHRKKVEANMKNYSVSFQ